MLSTWIGDVSALGLGELRSLSYLGEPLAAEVDVLASGKEVVDAGCFRLRSPQGDTELPWLRRGALKLRRGDRLVLEIRSEVSLRDPVLQVGVAVGCGHEVQRDYTLFLSPRIRDEEAPARAIVPSVATRLSDVPAVTRRPLPPPVAAEVAPPRFAPRKVEKRAKPALLPDRLILTGAGEAAGEPSLRLATELVAWGERGRAAGEAQRELLRLEYRMLAAMNEQATSQLAAAEKLRNMEATLADLQQRAGEFAGRIEKGVAPTSLVPSPQPATPIEAVPLAASSGGPPDRAAASLPPAVPAGRTGFLSEWSFYGAMLGTLLGVGGWIGWRQYRERRMQAVDFSEPVLVPTVDPVKPAEPAGLAEADFHIPQNAVEISVPVADPSQAQEPVAESMPPSEPGAPAIPLGGVFASSASDSGGGAPGTTVAEHFEVNPVMELADIMLSFGRVKGAAQALQEYIDHNPEQALQPWIRLMDVYRMAGMRQEFDQLAQNLNQHFNVEVQQWDQEDVSASLDQAPLEFTLDGEAGEAATPMPPKALTIEDIGHICNKVIESWGNPGCLDYLNQLLRDNRGGKRSGFTLPVVEEILFLIELLETRAALDKKP